MRINTYSNVESKYPLSTQSNKETNFTEMLETDASSPTIFGEEEQKSVKTREEMRQEQINKYKNNEVDFAVLMGGGVSTKENPINWDADGTAALTSEQIDYLKSKYDLSDMTKQEYYDFLADLSNMNVISAEEILSQFSAPMTPGVVVTSGISHSSVQRAMGHMGSSGNLYDNLEQHTKDLDELFEWLKSNYSYMESSQYLALKEYVDTQQSLYGKFEDIFGLLQ